MARIAGRQHGNVTREQLLAAGISSAGISRRLLSGVLHPEYRGVYRVGHRAPSVLARYAAAALASGEDAALTGPAAQFAYDLRRGQPPAPEVVTTAHRVLPGVIVHRARALPEDEVRIWNGIRIVTVPRLLVDLAAVLSLDALASAHHEARIRFRVAPATVEAVIARRPNVMGVAGLRAVVHGDVPVLLGRLERGFRRFLSDHRFPLPVTNRREGAHYVDCRWPGHGLTVELDSFRFHNDRKTWEGDRQRERDARSRGDRFRRFTWRDVFEDQAYMHAQLDRHLPRC